jgi:predicted Fe-Mo cluster-binding NifX family protein
MTPRELIAIPSVGRGGKRSRVSDVFAKAPFFTFVKIERGEMSGTTIEANEASEMTQGAGPIVMKNLKNRGVDVVLAGDVGLGAKTLMEISGIRHWKIQAGIKVSEAVNRYIESQT